MNKKIPKAKSFGIVGCWQVDFKFLMSLNLFSKSSLETLDDIIVGLIELGYLEWDE